MNAIQNRVLFLRWVGASFPEAYREAARYALAPPEQQPALSGLLDSISGAWERFTKSLPDIAQTYVNVKAQVDWLKLNADRVRKGLAPIDPATGREITPQTAPPPPPPNTQAAQVEAALANANAGVPSWMVYGGLALLALMLLRR